MLTEQGAKKIAMSAANKKCLKKFIMVFINYSLGLKFAVILV